MALLFLSPAVIAACVRTLTPTDLPGTFFHDVIFVLNKAICVPRQVVYRAINRSNCGQSVTSNMRLFRRAEMIQVIY